MQAHRSLLLLGCAWVLAAQVPQQGRADRAIAADPKTASMIDHILNMVGPCDPKVLTEKERFEQYILNTVGPVPLLGEAVGSGLNQWTNTPGEWGQGWGAYGKRYASNLGYNAVRQTVAYGIASIAHEDGRYFASTRHGIRARTWHAISSTLMARHPDGTRGFSFSSAGGVIAGVVVQSTWSPPSMQTARSMAANAGISFGTTAGFNILREFLPDILRRKK